MAKTTKKKKTTVTKRTTSKPGARRRHSLSIAAIRTAFEKWFDRARASGRKDGEFADVLKAVKAAQDALPRCFMGVAGREDHVPITPAK